MAWGLGRKNEVCRSGGPAPSGTLAAAFVGRIRGKSGDGVVRRAAQGIGVGLALGLGLGQSMPLLYPTRDLDLRRHKNVCNKTDTALLQLLVPFTIVLACACLLFTHPQKLRPEESGWILNGRELSEYITPRNESTHQSGRNVVNLRRALECVAPPEAGAEPRSGLDTTPPFDLRAAAAKKMQWR